MYEALKATVSPADHSRSASDNKACKLHASVLCRPLRVIHTQLVLNALQAMCAFAASSTHSRMRQAHISEGQGALMEVICDAGARRKCSPG